MGEPASALDFTKLSRAIGVKHVTTVNPHDIGQCRKVIKEEVERPETSVIISQGPCVLLPAERKRQKIPFTTSIDKCTGCSMCVQLGCPAIRWYPISPEEAKKMGKKEKQKGYARISVEMCTGCGQCSQLCKFEAITTVEGQ